MMEISRLTEVMEAVVTEQEPAVMDIDQKAEKVVAETEEGNKQLSEAIEKRRSAKKMQLTCVGITSEWF